MTNLTNVLPASAIGSIRAAIAEADCDWLDELIADN